MRFTMELDLENLYMKSSLPFCILDALDQVKAKVLEEEYIEGRPANIKLWSEIVGTFKVG